MQVLAAVSRNGIVESSHLGYICVANAQGEVIYSIGDPATLIYFRSSAKPIQCIPLVASGAAEHYGFSPQEIALACASHSGQLRHQELVQEMLKKIGLSLDYLRCGAKQPYNQGEAQKLAARGAQPSPLHCSCSGKHAAMLALALYLGLDPDGYEKDEHPLQQVIIQVVSQFTGIPKERIFRGIDGCGAPIYLVPVQAAAVAYARLVDPEVLQDPNLVNAAHSVTSAMAHFPEYVAGDGEFCTELMQATGGAVIAKIGAEGVYGIGLPKMGLGVAVKILDGRERAVYPVVVELLRQLGAVGKKEVEVLKKWHRYPVKNNLGHQVGIVKGVFDLANPANTAGWPGTPLPDSTGSHTLYSGMKKSTCRDRCLT
ncbi:MAG: asparaginase [Bacillota bacterium]